MAKMWPKVIPLEVRENPLRSAELKFYEALRTSLDNTFTVFYSRPWLGITPKGEHIDGECDFLVAHANLGILTLEVKGGNISHDPHTDSWQSIDRKGFSHRIKNPFSQASSSKHNILQKLSSSKVWQPRRIRANHAVVFTDCLAPKNGLGAQAPREAICDRSDLDNLRLWIQKQMRAAEPLSNGENGLGNAGLAALDELLAKPFTLKMTLGAQLEDDEQSLFALTPQQFFILDTIENIPKAGIAGAAGTGKTVLALESARRLAESGKRTLLVCYNQPLAHFFSRALRDQQNLEIGTFHQICRRFAGKVGLSYDIRDEKSFFENEAPELLIDAINTSKDLTFDAIVVDEGQDFRELWWTAIDAALKNSETSRLQVFFDCNQRVYERGGNPPGDIPLAPLRLSRNIRNTVQIHTAVMRHYKGYAITHNEVDGVEVERVERRETAEQLTWLCKRLHELINHERIAPCDIAVLTDSPKLIAEIKEKGRESKLLFNDATSDDQSAIVTDTIRRFKGLEKKVVILLATEGLLDFPELTYVAVSRATTFLSVCGRRDLLDMILPEVGIV